MLDEVECGGISHRHGKMEPEVCLVGFGMRVYVLVSVGVSELPGLPLISAFWTGSLQQAGPGAQSGGHGILA